MAVPSHIEIKRPLAFLTNQDGQSRAVFFYIEDLIATFYDVPGNSPRWGLTNWASKDDAIIEIKQLLDSGWSIHINRIEGLDICNQCGAYRGQHKLLLHGKTVDDNHCELTVNGYHDF